MSKRKREKKDKEKERKVTRGVAFMGLGGKARYSPREPQGLSLGSHPVALSASPPTHGATGGE